MVYDSSCGGCSSIAERLAGLLAVPVIVRSCRDPHLAGEFPVLSGATPCAKPLAVAVDGTGATELLYGMRLLWRGAALVAPGRRTAALPFAARILWQKLVRRP
ncbi:hypothetical protein [Streptosporangium sp. KLBMP 9127]|nr:hypothetical protein [Streptosporangium sp. KLBMP 9127]